MACKWFDICPLRNFERKGLIDNRWKKQYCATENNWKNCKRYQMEERGIYHSDNMMPDGAINKKIK